MRKYRFALWFKAAIAAIMGMAFVACDDDTPFDLSGEEACYSSRMAMVAVTYESYRGLVSPQTRATAVLRVSVNTPNSDYPSSSESAPIDSIWGYIGNVATQLNTDTGNLSLQRVIVRFPMTRHGGQTQFESGEIRLYPSAVHPPLMLAVWSKGKVAYYTQALTNTLSAGTMTTVSITMTSSVDLGQFSERHDIAKWVEQRELYDSIIE